MTSFDYISGLMESFIRDIEFNNFSDVRSYLSRELNWSKFNTFFKQHFNFSLPQKANCMNYKYDMTTGTLDKLFSEVIDMSERYGTVISVGDGYVFFEFIEELDIINWILDNYDKKILVIPVCIDNKLDKYLHQVSIVIDNCTRSIYFVDPNGYLRSFPKIDNVDYNWAVEEALSSYFTTVCESINYRYYKICQWNENDIGINPTFNSSLGIESGNCVAASLLIPHLCLVSDKDIRDIIKYFGGIKQDGLSYIIVKYSNFVANACRSIFYV